MQLKYYLFKMKCKYVKIIEFSLHMQKTIHKEKQRGGLRICNTLNHFTF